MEDSGYFSHRASEFKYSSGGAASGRDNSAAGRRIPSPDDLFKLSFDDLLSSRRYSYFRYGFADEGDFEDFKRELLDFRRLKRQARGESPPREESSPDELDATTIGNRNRGSGGGGGGGDSDGEFSGSVKVSDTTVRVSVVEERGDADGDEDAGGGGGGGEGRREAGWGNGGRPGRRGSSPDGEDDTTTTTTTTTTNPPRYTPQVKRSVSLRSYGGAGARARGRCESNKRNGVYFDEDCFLDDSSPPRSADAVQARANEAREAEDRGGREERERGAPGAGTSPPVDDALLFSVPPERRPARDGARRVSFRETPETFLYKEEPSLPRQTLVAPKHEPSSPRGSFAARNGANVPVSVSDVTKAPRTYNCASGTRSPRDSLTLSNESNFPRESVRVTSSGEPRTRTRSCDSVDEPRSPRESFAFSDEPRSRTKTCLSQNEPRSPRDSFAFSDEPRSPRESFAFSDEPRSPRESFAFSDKSRSPRESFAFSDEPRSPRESFAFSDKSRSPRESFAFSDEPRSPRESFAFSDEPRSPRESFASSDEARTRTKSCVSKDEPRSPRESFAFSKEANLPGRCGDPLNLPPNRDGETRQRPPPIAIPIKLVDFPVSRQSSSADGRERRLETDVTAVGEGLVETGPASSGISRTAASSLPPRVPVTIPIRVEKPTERPASSAARPARNDDAGGEGQGESDSGSGSAPSGNGRSARSRDCAAENGSRLGDRDWNREGVGQGQGQGSRSYNPSKRSSLLENLKRLSCHGRPRSGRGIDPFMEFFSGDEHFLEFERVFETVNNHRFSRDMDLRRQGSWHRDQQPQGGAERNPFRGDDGDDVDDDDDDDLGVLHIDETFLDFFDNDEDFMEFERELEKIKSNRRSRLLENLHRRSSCDIFSDVMSFCDRSLKKSGSGSSTPGASPKAERRLSAAKNVESELWNSAEEWGMVMNKLKRNSRLFSDQAAGGRTVADDSFPSFSSSPSSSATPAVLRRRSSSSSSSTTSSSTPSSGRAAVVAGHSEQCPCLRGELLI